MPLPSLVQAILFNGAPGTTQGAIRPVRPGFRPYSERTRGKRFVSLDVRRNSANATPNFQNVGIFGIELPYPTQDYGVDANGRKLPGFAPGSGTAGQPTQTGSYVEQVTASGGAATGISFIAVTDGGAGYSSAPTVAFTGGGGASAAATAIVRDGRVVGITITNAGTGYTSPPTISLTGGGTPNRVAVAQCGVGQQVTINTHIPHAAHAPLAAGGRFWLAEWQGRIIACDTNALSKAANDGALDGDQHLIGTSTNSGFTLASGTHPDGTTAVGVLTLAAGVPNGAIVTVYSGTVREVMALATHHFEQINIPALDVMWAVVGAAGDNSNTFMAVDPLT